MLSIHIIFYNNLVSHDFLHHSFFYLLVLFFRNSSSYLIVPPTQALPLPKKLSAIHQFFYKPRGPLSLGYCSWWPYWYSPLLGAPGPMLHITHYTVRGWSDMCHHLLSVGFLNGTGCIDQPTACQWVWLDDFFLNLWKLVVIYLFNPSILLSGYCAVLHKMCSLNQLYSNHPGWSLKQ